MIDILNLSFKRRSGIFMRLFIRFEWQVICVWLESIAMRIDTAFALGCHKKLLEWPKPPCISNSHGRCIRAWKAYRVSTSPSLQSFSAHFQCISACQFVSQHGWPIKCSTKWQALVKNATIIQKKKKMRGRGAPGSFTCLSLAYFGHFLVIQKMFRLSEHQNSRCGPSFAI